MYYTVTFLPNFILFSLNSVENSVDPGKMASERNSQRRIQQEKG